ncbi:MAG: GntR family transcriptional regulator [Deltaproteobacteria bacterium]|nr:GntR family transcriptional regulator [Deltaproteobacteria bacterium]
MRDLAELLEEANLERRLFEFPVPRYYQLSRVLQKLIQDEAFQPGDRFPTEEAISNCFHVSRPTANKAVQLLIDEGYLSRDKGLGTYVKEKPLVEFTFLTDSLSFAEQFPPDVPIRNELIWSKTVAATPKVAKALDLQPGAPTVLMRRLRFVYGHPLMVCDSQLSAERFPEIAKKEFVRDSLYATLAERYDCPVLSSERFTVAIEITEREVADLLEIQPFSPALMITGTSFTHGRRPVDYLRTFLREGSVLKTKVTRRTEKNRGIKTDPGK